MSVNSKNDSQNWVLDRLQKVPWLNSSVYPEIWDLVLYLSQRSDLDAVVSCEYNDLDFCITILTIAETLVLDKDEMECELHYIIWKLQEQIAILETKAWVSEALD